MGNRRGQGQALAVKRPAIRIDFEGSEIGELVPRAPVERLEPQIVDSFFADGVDNAFAIRAEADDSVVAWIVLQGSQRFA